VSSLTTATAIAARSTHTLAVKTDGTVVSWGANGDGQLGIGAYGGTNSTPVAVTSLTGVTAIAAGESFSLALKADGTLRSWGSNTSGMLGDGTSSSRSHSPVTVSNLTSVISIAAGGSHAAAVTSGGLAWAWGSNFHGQLGDGAATSTSNVPVAVSQATNLELVAVAQNATYLLSDVERLWACGRNNSAQLGDGTLRSRTSPVKVSEASFEWKVGTPTFSVLDGTYTATQNVTVLSATSGATIRYTTNGVDPTESDALVPSNGIVAVTESLTLKARAWKSGIPESNVDTVVYTLRVATPTLSPGTGTYTLGQNVTVSCSVSGATLHYTTSGADPTQSDPTVTSGGTVNVSQSLTLKVRAWKNGWTVSDAATAVYTLRVATPALSPSAGLYTSVQNVTATTATPGATLRYTTSGQEPTGSDTAVSSPISVGTALTLRVKGMKTGWTDSDTIIATYRFNLGTVAAPAFSPAGGTYTTGQTVTLSSATAGAVIRYTTDGTDPSLLSKPYTGALTISTPITIKARAFKADWSPSATTTAGYVFDYGTVAIPTLVPAGGYYATSKTVTVSTTTSGATIHYTTNGTEPTTADATIGSGATILVDRSMRLRAKAFKTSETPSAAATGDYWITGTIAAGDKHTLALKADGTVWAWGDNSQGQVGDGTWNNQRNSPVQVSGLTDVVAIAAGGLHSLAVKGDGSVWGWGYNANSQLGYSSSSIRYVNAVQVPGITNVISVAAGESFSLALKGDGTVCGWGANSSGQLGDGTLTQRTTPVCLSSPTGVAAIAAGSRQSLALKTDGGTTGTVWAWGYNFWGAVGDGTAATTREAPLVVLSNAIAVGTGYDHSLAALADGTVRGWGANLDGSVGDGTIVQRNSPTVVADLDSVTALNGGRRHSLTRTSRYESWVWGNHYSNDILYTPYRMPGAGDAVIAASAGGQHSVVARRDGSVWTWGINLNGQLGVGTTTQWYLPVRVPNFSLVSATWLTDDPDRDGLATWRELELGTDPLDADTNDDGLLDGAAITSGQSATSGDMDSDGVTNAVERQRGTDPFRADSDGDGSNDNVDAYPLDPTRSQPPAPVPGDTTPPCIILIFPTNAVLISGGCQ
jgi:alpha-tubulin suppressor-like RCC1 family protein